MTITSIKRQKQIIDLFMSDALEKLKESDLAFLLGYLQGMIANAELNNENETRKE